VERHSHVQDLAVWVVDNYWDQLSDRSTFIDDYIMSTSHTHTRSWLGSLNLQVMEVTSKGNSG